MGDIILKVKVSKTRLWCGIFMLLVALLHFALSAYLCTTLFEEGLHMLFSHFWSFGSSCWNLPIVVLLLGADCVLCRWKDCA